MSMVQEKLNMHMNTFANPFVKVVVLVEFI